MDQPAKGWLFDVDETQFENAVIDRSRQVPVVVDFWAPWCAPCRQLGPVLERLVQERQGEVVLAKVNIEDNPKLAERYGVQAIPQVMAIRDGQPVLEFTGLLPEEHLRAFLDRLSPTAADRLVSQAQELEATQAVEAETLYRRALEQDRNHERALLGLAGLLFQRGADAEASALLEELGSEGEVGAAAQRLQGLIFLRQRAQNLGDETTARRRLAANPNNAQASYELGCVLAKAGQYPEALEQLLTAAERDPKLAAGSVRPVMVQIFYVLGVRHPLADEYRTKLTRVLY